MEFWGIQQVISRYDHGVMVVDEVVQTLASGSFSHLYIFSAQRSC